MPLAFFVLTQYWRVTDRRTNSHVAIAITRATIASRGVKINSSEIIIKENHVYNSDKAMTSLQRAFTFVTLCVYTDLELIYHSTYHQNFIKNKSMYAKNFNSIELWHYQLLKNFNDKLNHFDTITDHDRWTNRHPATT